MKHTSQIVFQHQLRKHADLLLPGVPGPVSYRTHVVLDDDVHEAGLLHALYLHVVLDQAERAAELLAAFREHLAPLAHGAVLGDLAVGGMPLCRLVVVLHVAAGLATPEGLAVEGGPVDDGSDHAADVDEIERVVFPSPGEVGVVDLELDVGWDPGGLDGGDIGADDLGVGEFVAKVAVGCC